jgi:hypothetical protein
MNRKLLAYWTVLTASITPMSRHLPVYQMSVKLHVLANVFLSTTNEMQRYTMFFIVVSALHVSSGLSAHHQELKNCICSIGTCHTCVLRRKQFRLNTQVWQVPMLHIQFLSSWWWAERPLETFRALTTIKNIVYRCISLVVLKNTLAMRGSMNVKCTSQPFRSLPCDRPINSSKANSPPSAI